jgi:hypothetical protein
MLMIQDIYAYGPQHVVLVITDTCATMHIVTLLAVESLQHDGSDGRFRARVVVDGESFLDALFASAAQG